ncbi:MAG: T9SS type A sorting domain-containing protein [Crocinitomicaceae bacterium]
MNKKILFVALFYSTLIFGQTTKKVLFLGNSYTAVNNLPQIIAALAVSAGDNFNYDSHTPGGYTLQNHLNDGTSTAKIAQTGWDFVVLQEQSQLPSFPLAQVQTDCFPFADSLDSLIVLANPCAETMFYMTWGRETGDASNCAVWPPVCTYEGMDDLLRERYNQMAVDNQGVLSPVGALWRYLRQNNPTLQLYASDGSHPSLEGSYAAACSFYSTIFRKDPTLITNDYGLNPADALIIRNAAKAVVLDSLLSWHVGEYDLLYAGFVSQPNNFTFTFTNTSINATNFFWDFGDGMTSTDPNPVHTYALWQPTAVVLMASNDCGDSLWTVSTIMTIPPGTGGLGVVGLSKLEFNPNPVKDELFVTFQNADKIVVQDAMGRTVSLSITPVANGYSLNFFGVEKGIYFVQVEKSGKKYVGRVLKE